MLPGNVLFRAFISMSEKSVMKPFGDHDGFICLRMDNPSASDEESSFSRISVATTQYLEVRTFCMD